MTLWFRDLIDRIDGMSLRERVMVLVALLGVLALAWDTILMQPLDRAAEARQPQIKSLRAEVARLNEAIESLAGQDHTDPDAPVMEQADKARKRIAELDLRIGGLTHGLVAPKDMVDVLRQMLARTPPLKLLSLRTLPAEPLAAGAAGQNLPSRVFRHGVQLELEGSYLDLVGFLHAAQELSVQFYWQDLELDVTESSSLHIRITAHTLSADEAWLGV